MKSLLSHIQQQLRLALRDPAYLFTTLFLPAGLYWFFAVPESNSAYTATFLIGSFSAFSFFGVIFLQYSINSSQERQSTWAKYLNTLPIHPMTIIFSRLVTSIILGFLACGLIYLVGRTLTPTGLSLNLFLQMLFRLALGGLPFLLMGLVVGRLFNPRAVVPVANFFHLVLSFAGGLWKPPEILPEALQAITPWLPTYHYGQLTWSLSSDEIPLEPSNIIYLLVFGLCMGLCLFIIDQLPRLQWTSIKKT
jgi:ABC-2 type transport system permease protein